jgi:hypothetical protein
VPDTQLTNLILLVATAAETQHGQLGALARARPLDTTAASREQRLRRFLENTRVTQATHYRPLIRHALGGLAGQSVRVLIDRVDLTVHFQLLVVSAAFRRRSVPLAWTVLDHAGSTDAREQIALVVEALTALPTGVRVILHGDGEFRSTELFAWAQAQAVRVVLGLSESTLIFSSRTAPAEGQSIATRYGPRRTRPRGALRASERADLVDKGPGSRAHPRRRDRPARGWIHLAGRADTHADRDAVRRLAEPRFRG